MYIATTNPVVENALKAFNQKIGTVRVGKTVDTDKGIGKLVRFVPRLCGGKQAVVETSHGTKYIDEYEDVDVINSISGETVAKNAEMSDRDIILKLKELKALHQKIRVAYSAYQLAEKKWKDTSAELGKFKDIATGETWKRTRELLKDVGMTIDDITPIGPYSH